MLNTVDSPLATVVLAHGAGAGMNSDFMTEFVSHLTRLHLNVVRFNFPYMVKSIETGKRRPPDRAPVLIACWRNVITRVLETCPGPYILAGKSMGGRMLTHFAVEYPVPEGVLGLVCLGYPFHPVGKPEKIRVDHLASVSVPIRIFQGQRDKFGLPCEVSGYGLTPNILIHWVTDGDHDLKPRKSSGSTWHNNLAWVAQQVHTFISTNNTVGV